MRFQRRRRDSGRGAHGHGEDPLAGVANLFDVGLAFMVALIIALFAAVGMFDLFDPEAEFTMLKQNADGTMELITKTPEEITVQEVTDTELEGRGTRLGTAYRLGDGRIVYVPEEGP